MIGALLGQEIPIPAQLGILVPFLLAFGWLGRWLISRLDKSETAKDALYERIVADIIPAMNASTVASTTMLDLAAELRQELIEEKTARVRLEERERMRVELERGKT